MKREIITYGNHFLEFYSKLNQSVQQKIDYVFELIKTIDFIPVRFFKHMENTDGLFEVRVEYESNIYRIFCFFDEGKLVVLINAFQKQSKKTPKKELVLAEKLKKQYFIDKKIDLEHEKGKKIKK
jgi:phage-related protein